MPDAQNMAVGGSKYDLKFFTNPHIVRFLEYHKETERLSLFANARRPFRSITEINSLNLICALRSKAGPVHEIGVSRVTTNTIKIGHGSDEADIFRAVVECFFKIEKCFIAVTQGIINT